MSEKLKTQQMNNDLEKLTHELEKIGLNKERLLLDEGSDDRYLLSHSHTRHYIYHSVVAPKTLSAWNPNKNLVYRLGIRTYKYRLSVQVGVQINQVCGLF